MDDKQWPGMDGAFHYRAAPAVEAISYRESSISMESSERTGGLEWWQAVRKKAGSLDLRWLGNQKTCSEKGV